MHDQIGIELNHKKLTLKKVLELKHFIIFPCIIVIFKNESALFPLNKYTLYIHVYIKTHTGMLIYSSI